MRTLILSLGILICASTVFGQAGVIGLYVDRPYVTCDFVDYGPALVSVYAVHRYFPGATGSQWMIISGGGWNCTYVGEIINTPTASGTTVTGISLGYGGCYSSEILLVTILYFCQGLSPECAYIEVVPDPASVTGTIEVLDCSDPPKRLVCDGSNVYANAAYTGVCWPWCWGAVEETSWGNLKALYQ